MEQDLICRAVHCSGHRPPPPPCRACRASLSPSGPLRCETWEVSRVLFFLLRKNGLVWIKKSKTQTGLDQPKKHKKNKQTQTKTCVFVCVYNPAAWMKLTDVLHWKPNKNLDLEEPFKGWRYHLESNQFQPGRQRCCAFTVLRPLPSDSRRLYKVSNSSPHKSILGSGWNNLNVLGKLAGIKWGNSNEAGGKFTRFHASN